MALAECKLKLNKPKEAYEILEQYKEQKQNDKDYLLIRALTLKEILKSYRLDIYNQGFGSEEQ